LGKKEYTCVGIDATLLRYQGNSVAILMRRWCEPMQRCCEPMRGSRRALDLLEAPSHAEKQKAAKS